MVVLTPKFASLLAFIISSSVITGVDALPYNHERGVIEALGQYLPLPAIIPRHDPSETDIEVRGRHHHHKGHHHHGSHGTKVYADDPLIVSGDGNHVHAHSHKRHSHHGHHGHHGHHAGAKVYADDPLIVSGDKNHIHSHTHKRANGQLVSLGTRKNHQHAHHHHQGQAMELTAFKRILAERGLLDPLVPLAGSLPGVAGVIGLVNMLSHTVLSDTLANLIISPTAGAMSIQSANGEQTPSYTINASKSASTTMYLVAQNATANIGSSEQIVLVTMPMLNSTDQSVKMYCASYDPNSPTASQLSSQPCSYNPNSGLDINSTSTHFSQLFSWNIDTGEIWPLWQKSPNAELMANAANAPDGTSPAEGYVIGGMAPGAFSAQQSGSGGKLAMVFKLASFSANNATAAPPASSVEPSSVMTWSDDCDEDADDSQTGENGQTDASSDDYETCPTTGSDDATDDQTAPEDVQAYEDPMPSAPADAGTSIDGSDSPATGTVAAQETTVVTSTLTILVGPTEPAVASPTTNVSASATSS
ncbi:hypothetical protein FRC12_014293 [Ceratobasidium sp. 428]|nr:hypothetical protein FRC12_014293 [Ceratobasidium sp. 428]